MSVSTGQIMFNDNYLNLVKTLHLEITSLCNAACPQCARFSNGNFNPDLNLSELSLADIQAKLSESFVKNLDKMFICGNYGDPAASKHTIDVYRWFRQINPDITLGMNTNGGIKTTKWWQQLGNMLNREQDYVVFSIDGLADTNHIYRQNVDWTRLMSNVQAFISAGGRAHWDMLIFKHNEHQVEAARQLSQDLGFVEFRCKVSKRISSVPVDYLQLPDNYSADFHSPDNVKEINCIALTERSIYMDYTGNILPCCWIGSRVNKKTPVWPWPFTPDINVDVCKRTCGISGSNNFHKQWIDYENR